jgi:apolipoprotein N-acyltransferase
MARGVLIGRRRRAAGLGQAPFALWLCTPLRRLACACQFLSRRPPPAGGCSAWAGGAGYFALTLHWIVEPFFVDAARHGWMAPFALVSSPAGSRCSGRLAGGPAVRLRQARRPRAGLRAALTLAEAARGTVLTGFPWAFPGHALIDTPWLPSSA